MDEDDRVSSRGYVVDRLGRGIPVADSRFDEVFPPEWRRRSQRFWTPVEVAMRVAFWFSEMGCRRVVDIGSGVGKLCIVGALSTDLEFVGVEQRESLVRTARDAAKVMGVDKRVTFTHSPIDEVDVSGFEAFYLYNPFGENLYSEIERLDSNVELSEERFRRDTRVVERIFRVAPIGSRIITYHGFGGRMPNSYAPERTARIGTDALRLWVKRRPEATGYYIETGYEGLRIDGPMDRHDEGPTNISGR